MVILWIKRSKIYSKNGEWGTASAFLEKLPGIRKNHLVQSILLDAQDRCFFVSIQYHLIAKIIQSPTFEHGGFWQTFSGFSLNIVPDEPVSKRKTAILTISCKNSILNMSIMKLHNQPFPPRKTSDSEDRRIVTFVVVFFCSGRDNVHICIDRYHGDVE